MGISNQGLDISFDSDEHKWNAVEQRSPLANGLFVYGVLSTKVYCRPICPARIPRRCNVIFFRSSPDAQSAGFRSCMRCRPDLDSPPFSSTRTAVVTNACRLIAEKPKISLDELAKELKLSKFHFQRTFKAVMGITPQQYKMAYRHSGKSQSAQRVVFAVGQCYLGHILVAVSERGICAIDLGDDPEALVAGIFKRFPDAEISANIPQFDALVSILGGAAESARISEWELPLDIQGTAFQHRVWNSLREIPWGQSRTYADIAKGIGCPAAVRAVAKACGSNPLAIAIPCHRVIRTNDKPSGYRWGLEKKKALEELEKSSMDTHSGFTEFKDWVESCMA